MDKSSIRVFTIAAICLATTAALSASASASLMATQFGFPIMTQSGQSFTFNSDVASATDFESLNIDFPAFEGIMAGSGMPASTAFGNSGTIGAGMPDMGNIGNLFDLSMFKFR